MYRLPDGYVGKQIAFFDGTKEYLSDCFFAKEGTCVVESELGNYLETSNEPLSRFGYRFRINNTDKAHMLVVAYPDDKRRHMMINDCFSYDLSTGIMTGDEYEITGDIKKSLECFTPEPMI